MPSKSTTKKSKPSPKSAKNSRAAWLKSLAKGDKVWVCYDTKNLSTFEKAEAIIHAELFDGFCLEETRRKLWIACEYDGGTLISTKDIYPTKKEAKTANAPKIIAAIKKKRRKLFDELSKWAALQKKYQNMLPNTDPIVEKATFANLPKMPKTWGTVNGQKF